MKFLVVGPSGKARKSRSPAITDYSEIILHNVRATKNLGVTVVIFAFDFPSRPDQSLNVLQSGQLVRVNLAGLQTQGVMFQAAVTDAVGHIVKQISENPPVYLVKLLFSFRGVSEVEVPADRIHAG